MSRTATQDGCPSCVSLPCLDAALSMWSDMLALQTWIFPDMDAVHVRCWTRKKRGVGSRTLGDKAEASLESCAACLSRSPSGAGTADADRGDGSAVSSYADEVTLRAPQWNLGTADLAALRDAEVAERAKAGTRPEAGIRVDVVFDARAGHWRILRFAARTDARGGESPRLSSVEEVMAMLQRRAEAITADQITATTSRSPPTDVAATSGTTSGATSGATSGTTSGATSSGPSWGPTATLGRSTDRSQHPWVVQQTNDPRFSTTNAISSSSAPVALT